jgi:hypothetical protein
MTIIGWARGGGCAVVLALAFGCSTKAKVTLRDGSVVKGTIAKGTPDAVWLYAGQAIEPEQVDASLGTPVAIGMYGNPDIVGVLSPGTAVSWTEEGGPMAWERVCVEPFGGPQPGPKKPRTCVPSEEMSSLERSVRVPRADIADVSHPGGGPLVAGAILTGIGVSLLILGASQGGFDGREESKCSTECYAGDWSMGSGELAVGVGILLLLPGLPLFASGSLRYWDSRARYAAPETSAPPTPTQGAKGIKLGFEF